jgi:predicted nucleic acid-binding protein
LPFDLERALGGHDPNAWTATLAYRPRSALPFDASAVPPERPLSLDTTVYVDALRPRGLPPAIAALVATNPIVHSAVACAEIAVSIGHLDPAHPGTARTRAALEDLLERIDRGTVHAPDPEVWVEAALLAGILARTQGLAKPARRDLLFDALILLAAAEAGCVLVSRNIRHMDLLTRLRPDAAIILYDLA